MTRSSTGPPVDAAPPSTRAGLTLRASRCRLDRRHQLFDPDRLHEVVVHPGGQEPLAITLHRLGGHRHDPRPRIRGPPLDDPARRLDAVHLGHLDIGEQQIVGLPLERLERLDPVPGHVGSIAELLEQPERELLVHHVVLGQQDPQRVPRAELRIDGARRGFLASVVEGRAEHGRQNGLQRRGLDRLRHERVDARGLPSRIGFDLASSDRRGDHDGDVRRPFVQACRHVQAVRARHQHVEHRDVEGLSPSVASASSPPGASTTSIPQAPSSALMRRRFVALSSTTSARRPANDPSRRSAVGAMSVAPTSNVRWNVLPSPGTPVLSTHTVPSISSASRRLIARPSPVPP